MKISAKVVALAFLTIRGVSGQGKHTYHGPGNVFCGQGNRDDSLGGTCWIPPDKTSKCHYNNIEKLGEPLMGSPVPAVGDIKMYFYIKSGCSLSCDHCTFVSSEDSGCYGDKKKWCPDPNQCMGETDYCYVCNASTGASWCPRTNSCLQAWDPGTPEDCDENYFDNRVFSEEEEAAMPEEEKDPGDPSAAAKFEEVAGVASVTLLSVISLLHY